LGGHSLRATQIIARVRETFQVELPVRSFLETPTVAELAKRIEVVRWLMHDSQALASAALDEEEGEL
jgi:hypothetical protein